MTVIVLFPVDYVTKETMTVKELVNSIRKSEKEEFEWIGERRKQKQQKKSETISRKERNHFETRNEIIDNKTTKRSYMKQKII